MNPDATGRATAHERAGAAERDPRQGAGGETYRGPQFVALGTEIAVDGRLDPHILGTAAHTGRHDPESLKRKWHYLARFGTPAPAERG